jgi:hypothetical protein
VVITEKKPLIKTSQKFNKIYEKSVQPAGKPKVWLRRTTSLGFADSIENNKNDRGKSERLTTSNHFVRFHRRTDEKHPNRKLSQYF